MPGHQRLPKLGHIGALRKVDVAEPLERAYYERQGSHLLVGQRKHSGSTDALVLLGKCIESTRIGNKYDANVWLDVRTPHVVYIVGKRGSGKSYDLGILAEGLLLSSESRVTTKDKALTTVIFDTQDQFWSLGDAPSSEVFGDGDQIAEIRKWGLEPLAVPSLALLSPRGESVEFREAQEYSIDPADLGIEDWCSLLQEHRYTAIGHTIETILEKVTETGYTIWSGPGRSGGGRVAPKEHFDVTDLLACLRDEESLNTTTAQQTRNAVLWRLQGLVNSSLFVSGGLRIQELLESGRVWLFFVGHPEGFGERHGKSYLTRRRRGEEGGGGGSVTGGTVPSV